MGGEEKAGEPDLIAAKYDVTIRVDSNLGYRCHSLHRRDSPDLL